MAASLKQHAVAAARRAGLVSLFEAAKFAGAVARARGDNAKFREDNPGFAPPPLWWMHDMYSHTSYRLYHETGAATAAALAAAIRRHVEEPALRVADWGCGLGRVIRHLPDEWRRHGYDYNSAAVDWCRRRLPGARFEVNGLMPPLPADDASFDVVYALSVFTHLSERAHAAWIAEVERVLAPGGVFLGAFHMHPHTDQLLADERRRFDEGRLVTRAGVLEGGRTFTAFHPEAFVRDVLLSRFEPLEGPVDFFGQSLIAVRKPRRPDARLAH